MDAAAVAAEAAKEAALAASVAAVAAAKDAAVAAATAKEEAVAASAAALKAEEAAATASVAALNAKEAADVAVTAGQAAATAAAAAMQASNKRKFAAVALNAVETAPVAATAGEAAATAAAVMQASKKREFAAVPLNAVETAPVAATAGEAAAATALQAYDKGKFNIIDVEQNPQGSGDVDDAASVDLISNLPDAVLCSIVSLLPTKEAARTQGISRRWSPLWRATPLNLVAEHKVSSKDPAFVELISKILSVHPGPTRRFSLRLSIGDCHGKIKEWLSSQALDKLQEFELIAGRVRGRGRLCHIPSSMYRFTPTLRVAKFCGCHFSKLIAKLWLQFPCLKQLTLDRVSITEDAIQGMLSGCSALESLELKDNFGFACLCISSKTL